MKRPKAVLFDWDNTLANSWPIIFDALTKTFEDMGHEPWTFEEVKSGRDGIHHSLRESFPRIFGKDWEQAKERYYAHFLKGHLELIAPLDGAKEVLDALKAAGIITGIVSNKTGKYLREEVTHLEWDDYFHTVVGATDAKADKPSADPVLLALEHVGIEAGDEVWFVGDSATDVEAALNSKCHAHVFGDGVIDQLLMEDERHVLPVMRHDDHTRLRAAIDKVLK